MSLTRMSRPHLSLLVLGCALAFGACGDDGGDDGGDGNGMQPDARTGGDIDSGPGGPDAMTGLPACANAEANNTSPDSIEVVEYGGPNVLMTFAGDDVAVIYPTDSSNFGTGDFDLSAASEWTLYFCVDDDSGNCNPELVPESGNLKITNLTNQNIAGELVDAVFVDDADSPTCQATVNVSFDEARPQPE